MPDAPAWLREAFKDGIDDREMVYRDGVGRFRKKGRPYAGANPWCWLAQFDPRQLPCAGQPGKVIERFHFINRQRVEAVVWEQLRGAVYGDPCETCHGLGTIMDPTELAPPAGLRRRRVECFTCGGRGAFGIELSKAEVWDLILLAAWDCRNGGLGCEHHHRRLDSHADSPRAPVLCVPEVALPEHVLDFTADYPGLILERQRRFPPEHTIATADPL